MVRRAAGVAVFCQAEDGIRGHCVTGVQTCALPISRPRRGEDRRRDHRDGGRQDRQQIGRASCRERVLISMVLAPVQKRVGKGVVEVLRVLHLIRGMHVLRPGYWHGSSSAVGWSPTTLNNEQ